MKRFALLLAAATLALAGCATTPPPVSDQVANYYEANKNGPALEKPITVTALGDSVTEGNSPDFNAGKLGTGSWPSYLPKGEQFVGGWAKKGSTTAQILEGAKPVAADVLVIIAGTNDSGKLPFSESARNLKDMAQKVGAKRVIVSTIPPRDADPAASTSYNAQLEPFVNAQGWELVDAMAGIRAGDRYAPGMTSDGVHPTEPAVRMISEAIARQIKS